MTTPPRLTSLTPSLEAAPAPACGHPGCAAAPPRLTPGRAKVLALLRDSGRAMGAYELIEAMSAADARSVAPITVYRALDALIEARLIHRLASKNAYLACHGGHCAGESVAFLICERCGTVAEAGSDALKGDLGRLAAGAGFAARAEAVEILGLCARCRAA